MVLIVLTLLVVLAWYAVTTRLVDGSVSARCVLAGTGASAQIVITCMGLALSGRLGRGAVIAASLAVTAILLAASFARGEPGEGRVAGLARSLARDAVSVARSARKALGWETLLLAAVALFATAWLATAVVFYPPRGVDDLVYHLPPIYQAVQDGEFQILPLALRKFFAFPFSADMPFLWVVRLSGSTRWVDGSQATFIPFAMICAYALGRRYGLSPRGAFAASTLFGLMPVVLHQATSNYVDLISNAWLLAAAAALLEYESTGRRAVLALSGLAAGLLLGSKYQSLVMVLALSGAAAALIVAKEAGRWPRLAAVGSFGLPLLGAGGYWYARNILLFANPFYPLPVKVAGLTLFEGDWPQGPSILSRLLTDPAEMFRIPLRDPGLGTFDGGFGFLMCGFGLPAAIWLAMRVRTERRQGARGRLVVLALVPAGILTFLLTPHAEMALTPRYVLALGAFGYIGFARMGESAAVSRHGIATALRIVSVAAGFLPLLPAAAASRPVLNLAPVAAEAPAVRSLSELRYLRWTLRDLAQMSACWAPLDEITKGGAGLSVYQAADFKVFWTAPTFGSELQNRVWNFGRRLDVEPEAFFFHTPRNDGLYIGREIRREAVAGDPRYRLIASENQEATTLYVSREALAEKGREARLIDYYRRTRGPLVDRTAETAASVPEGSVLILPYPLAAAFLVHAAEGRLRGDIEPAAAPDVALVAGRHPARVVYTAQAPLPGRPSRPGLELVFSDERIVIFRNEPVVAPPPSGAGP